MKIISVVNWVRQGTPWVWLNAGAVCISVLMVVSLLGFIAVKGATHFWPNAVMAAHYQLPNGEDGIVMGEIFDREVISRVRLQDSGIEIAGDQDYFERLLLKTGNREVYGIDFRWVLADYLTDIKWPEKVVVIERREWGNYYGFIESLSDQGQVVAEGDSAWSALTDAITETNAVIAEIEHIEKHAMGRINYQLDRLRLKERAAELEGRLYPEVVAGFTQRRAALDAEYTTLHQSLGALYQQADRYQLQVKTIDGQESALSLSVIVAASQPNAMGVFAKLGFYANKMQEFIFSEPREANTEGGIYPAIFGTVTMVILMSILVTPFGVIAAIYLREYANQGVMTRLIRIAVNNLAGVPSIVFGVFGLGFFVYFVGGGIDKAFYPEASPAPVFGTPGLLWASLTLALLTVPVVIVSTEEGLSRVPKALREGSMALGATKAETLWRVVIPMSSPAMMTGLILAIARAAGEVAPLMLVGVVKLAPSLPIDMNMPFIHFERKFMHLGFHIYDVGFQSPNVEAARPLVYATAFLLVGVIAVLNLTAVMIRNRLREKYKSLEN